MAAAMAAREENNRLPSARNRMRAYTDNLAQGHTNKASDNARVSSLMQVFAAESAESRLNLVNYLDSVQHPDASRALAKLAIFSEEANIRAAAVQALQCRCRFASGRVHASLPAI